jgi:hypothetical protein
MGNNHSSIDFDFLIIKIAIKPMNAIAVVIISDIHIFVIMPLK